MLVQPVKPAVAAAFQDVLVPIMNVGEDEAALRAADEVCQMSGGRAVAMLASPLPSAMYAGDPFGGVEMWSSVIATLHADAKKEAAKVKERLAKASSPMEFRTTEMEYFLSREAVLMSARHADATILLRPSKEEDRNFRFDLIESVLFESGRPVLIVPPTQKKPITFNNVVVAWNASRESARAVGDAAGIIDGAEKVTIVTINAEPSSMGVGQAPGADIAAHLAHRTHQGEKIEVRNVDKAGRTEADCVLDVAAAIDADLIVMGGYGHARAREFVFGGMTRDLLHTADRPLFMSH